MAVLGDSLLVLGMCHQAFFYHCAYPCLGVGIVQLNLKWLIQYANLLLLEACHQTSTYDSC